MSVTGGINHRSNASRVALTGSSVMIQNGTLYALQESADTEQDTDH